MRSGPNDLLHRYPSSNGPLTAANYRGAATRELSLAQHRRANWKWLRRRYLANAWWPEHDGMALFDCRAVPVTRPHRSFIGADETLPTTPACKQVTTVQICGSWNHLILLSVLDWKVKR